MGDRVRIQIVPLGDWLGHSAGEQHYGEAEARAMVERANRIVTESGNPLQIDYEHASLDPPATGAPAAGWMHAFTLEDDGIYAEVEWTERAAEYINAGEYKYISPVIASGMVDPVSGDPVPIELFNAALTNQPFMHDRIKQVVASAIRAAGYAEYFTNAKQITNTLITNQGGKMPDLKETVDAIVAALPGATSGEDVMNFLKKALEVLAIMPGAPEGGMAPSPEQMGEMETEMKQQMMNARSFTELAALLSVAPDRVLPTVAAMTNKTTDTTALATELAAVKARLLDREVSDLVAANERKIPPAKREFWANHARTHGVEATRSVLAELPDVIPAAAVAVEVKTNSKTPTPEFVAFRKAKGRTEEQIQTEWDNLKKNKEA